MSGQPMELASFVGRSNRCVVGLSLEVALGPSVCVCVCANVAEECGGRTL